MRGYSHAVSGAVTGTAAGEILSFSVPATAALAAFTAGMALLPDLDSCGSSCARSVGFLSGAVAHVVRRVSGGHRHATHSVLGIAVFTGLAWLACAFRSDDAGKAGLALLVTLAVAGALEALHIARSHVADVAGIGVAALVAWHGRGLALIPLAVALGCAVHVAGDCLTVEGCPAWLPFSRRHAWLLPQFMRFETGHLAERWIVDPLLVLALAGLAFSTVSVALSPVLHHAQPVLQHVSGASSPVTSR